jgi:hypothetical protein
MRDIAREEGACAGTADGDVVADLERDLSGEHPGDLIAVAVQVEERSSWSTTWPGSPRAQ